eukprot:TRINITY_DN10460_c2_g1_i1.p2 TRINITY_DN10460_c2_g1~~TRINITY_DN10460_c2_g1_i1.p2  ORF type:complete len:132 (-),score=7.12 TRINITY_DN10460_c2_g1_i1:603-998(-)
MQSFQAVYAVSATTGARVRLCGPELAFKGAEDLKSFCSGHGWVPAEPVVMCLPLATCETADLSGALRLTWAQWSVIPAGHPVAVLVKCTPREQKPLQPAMRDVRRDVWHCIRHGIPIRGVPKALEDLRSTL